MAEFEFEIALSVSDYADGSIPPKGSDAAGVLFAKCRADTESALKAAVNDLLEAGVGQEVLDRLLTSAGFVEFDSGNPHHAAGYFRICLAGKDADISEAKQKWMAWMNK